VRTNCLYLLDLNSKIKELLSCWQALPATQSHKTKQNFKVCGKSLPDKTIKILSQISAKTIICHRDSFKISPTHNTDGIINCLRQPGQFLNRLQKSMRANSFRLSNFVYHNKSCYQDKHNRAASQRSAVMVFAALLRQFYHDGTTPAHQSGLNHLDNFIMTRKLSSIYRDLAKTTPPRRGRQLNYTTGPSDCLKTCP